MWPTFQALALALTVAVTLLRLVRPRAVTHGLLVWYLVLLAVNDTLLPSALLWLLPPAVWTTHSVHVLPILWTGPVAAALLLVGPVYEFGHWSQLGSASIQATGLHSTPRVLSACSNRVDVERLRIWHVRQPGNSPCDTIVTGSIIVPLVLPQMPTAFVVMYGGLTVAAVVSAAAAMQHKEPPPPPAAQQWLQQLQLEASAASLAAVAYAASRPMLWRLACDVGRAVCGCGRGAGARTAAGSRSPQGDGKDCSRSGSAGTGLSAATPVRVAGRVHRGLSASSAGLVPWESCADNFEGDAGSDEMIAGEGCRREGHTGEGEMECEEQGQCAAARPLEMASAASAYAPAECDCGCGVCECGYVCRPGCAGCEAGATAFALQEAMEVLSPGPVQARGRANYGSRSSCEGGRLAPAGCLVASASGSACADAHENTPSATRPPFDSSPGGHNSALAAISSDASSPHPSSPQLQPHPDPDPHLPLGSPWPPLPPPQQQQQDSKEQQETQAAPLSPLAQAQRLIRDASQLEYLGATALQRVVLRLPDLQPGDLPGGWVRELLGRLAERWGCGCWGGRG